MYRYRKLPACLLALSLVLSGCGTQMPQDTTDETVEETALVTTAVTTEPTEETAAETTVATEPPIAYDQTPEIRETELFSRMGIKVTANTLTYGDREATLHFTIESDREDELFFSPDQGSAHLLAVNGITFPAQPVTYRAGPGETVHARLVFPYEDLLKLGITQISEIRFSLEGEEVSTGLMQISTGVPRENLVTRILKKNEDLPLEILHLDLQSGYNQGGVRHAATILARDPEGREHLLLDFENYGGDVVLMSLGERAVNGLQLRSEENIVTLLPGCHSLLSYDLNKLESENHLKDLGIEKLGNFSLSLSLFRQNLLPIRPAQTMKVTLDPAVPDYQYPGEPVLGVENLQIFYAGARKAEETGDLTLLLVCDNRTNAPFFIQASSLSYGDQEIPVESVSLHMPGNGCGIFAVPISGEAAEGIDIHAGSFTLNTLQKVGSQRKITELTLQNQP